MGDLCRSRKWGRLAAKQWTIKKKKERQRRKQERECGRERVWGSERKRKWDTDGVRQEGVLLGDTEAGCQYDVFISLLASCQAYGSRWPGQAGGRWEASRREYWCPLIHFFNTHLIFSPSSSHTFCWTTHIACAQVSSCLSAFLTLHGRIIGGFFFPSMLGFSTNKLIWFSSALLAFLPHLKVDRKVGLQPRALRSSQLKGDMQPSIELNHAPIFVPIKYI